MRILSVDLGVRNLAWCVLDRDKDAAWADAPFDGMKVTVHAWRLVDVTEYGSLADDTNLNDLDVADCVPMFIAALKAHREELTSGVELALLEQQPVGRATGTGAPIVSNVRTKVLSHILQAFLLEHGVPDIRFVSPRLKTAGVDTETYRDRKKAAVETVTACAPRLGEWGAWWDARRGKRDDLADAFLQGVAGARRPRPKSRAAKRPRAEPPPLAFVPDVL